MNTNRNKQWRVTIALLLVPIMSASIVRMADANEPEGEMNVGARSITVGDNEWGGPFPVLVMYPTLSPPAEIRIGPYALDVAWEAPVADEVKSLVVISHGTGGTHLGYRGLAAQLASHGYIVLSPEHPGNNRNNDELAGTAANLVNRPRHVSLAIDAVATSAHFGSAASGAGFSMIGHSMGGYTALAVAGGNPSESPGAPVSVQRDTRVTHVVLLAPATPWFQDEGALASVDVPILMFSGAQDAVTPLWHAQVVLNGLPESTSVDHRVVDNAGHFSFMSPFPDSMRDPGFAPSQDPAGFDRDAFQRELAIEILAFLARR